MILYPFKNGFSVPVAGDQETAVIVPVREPPILVPIYIDVLCVEVEVDVLHALEKEEDIIPCINDIEVMKKVRNKEREKDVDPVSIESWDIEPIEDAEGLQKVLEQYSSGVRKGTRRKVVSSYGHWLVVER